MKIKYFTLPAVLIISIVISFFYFSRDISHRESDRDITEPSEWMMTQRLFPYMQADPDVYSQALRQLNSMKSSLEKTDELSWTFAGPVNIGGKNH